MQNLPHPEKKNKGKKKQGNVIITTTIVSSLILSSIGFIYAFYLDFSLFNTNSNHSINASSDIYFDNDKNNANNKVSSFFDLEFQKKEFSNQVEELSEELLETKNRLIQLKRDILIRGGKKESDYLEKISKLEEALSDAESKSSVDKQSLLSKDHEISKLQEELKEIENFYVQKAEKIQKELLATVENYEKKLKDAEEIISQIHVKLTSKNTLLSQENFENLLSKIKDYLNLNIVMKDGDIEINGFLFGENTRNANQAIAIAETNYNIPQRKNNLEARIHASQNKIDELEAQYADDYYQKEDRLEEEILPKPYNDNVNPSSLYDSIFELKNELHESEEKLNHLQKEYDSLEKNKENEIIQLRNEIETLKNKKTNQNSRNDYSKLEEYYENELSNLKSELLRTHKNLENYKNGEITFDKSYYENRIKFLEDAIEIQKEALISAQEEILRISEDDMDGQLENFYQNQIDILTNKNLELEEHLKNMNVRFQDLAENKPANYRDFINEENKEIAFGQINYSSSSSLGKIIANLKSNLNIESEKRLAAENELILLREELLNITAKNESKSDKINDLEEKVKSINYYNEILKNELLAYEASNDVDMNKILLQPLDSNLLKKLHAKITYLTTRLNQEKNKNDHSENKLEEMNILIKEIKERNQELEKMIHRESYAK